MFTSNELNEIQNLIKEFFHKMNFEMEMEFQAQGATLLVNLKTKNSQILIGENGRTLDQLQYLLKHLIKRQILLEKRFYLNLDVNQYKKKKLDYLRELAQVVADEVALSKKEKILAPMKAYERRAIHLEVATRRGVTSESIGQEPQRRVVIRPYP